jgi:DNA-binding NarL/FixJ family response regulator
MFHNVIGTLGEEMVSGVGMQSVLLAHDRGWGWGSIERVVEGISDVVELHVTYSVEEIIELVNRHDPDVVISKPKLEGRSIASLIGKLRFDHGFSGRIYLIADRVDGAMVAEYAWIGIDGLVPLRDIPRGRLEAFLCVLVSGMFRIGSIDSSNAFLDLVRREGQLPSRAMQLTERQVHLLRAWHRSDHNPTYQELASDFNVSVSTVKRDIEDMYEKFGVSNRVALGALAVQCGYLP